MKKSLFPLLYIVFTWVDRWIMQITGFGILALACGLFMIYVKFGAFIAAPLLLLCMVGIFYLVKFWKFGWNEIELWHYANMTEWIIESSESPNDTKVYKRAQYHRRKLVEAGNKFDVKVFEIIFNPRYETWEEFSAPIHGRRDRETRDIMHRWETFILKDLNKKYSSDTDRIEFHYTMHLNQEL